MFDGISALPRSGGTPGALRHCALDFQTSERQWHSVAISTCFSAQSFPFESFFKYSGTMPYRSVSSSELPV
jgi:hypothetical protein